MPTPILTLVDVSRSFPSPAGPALQVLSGVSLEIATGESVAIVGPSGSGKSTLLHIMGGLDRATAGRVLLDGQSLGDLDESALAAVRNTRIGFVFQSHYLLPQCSVLENVLIPTMARRKAEGRLPKEAGDDADVVPASPGEEFARGRRLLEIVGLGHRLDHFPGQLSGGERQRVALVRALINQPDLLLADEPTGALDLATASDLARLLVELNREQGLALVTVTHSRDLAQAMGRQLTLRAGRLVP
jgi:predicted ABC-type transport system involved in lysophospholipase L1 biosynthesis ATPase subunit